MHVMVYIINTQFNDCMCCREFPWDFPLSHYTEYTDTSCEMQVQRANLSKNNVAAVVGFIFFVGVFLLAVVKFNSIVISD